MDATDSSPAALATHRRADAVSFTLRGALRRRTVLATAATHAHGGTLAQLVGPVDNDLVAGFHAGKHRHTLALVRPKLDRHDRNRIVGLHQIDERAGRAALDRRRG